VGEWYEKSQLNRNDVSEVKYSKMNDDKELLICLLLGFANSLKLIDVDEDEDDTELNDELNLIGLAIEKMTIKVFGKKIPMDFGLIQIIINDLPIIIQNIRDHGADADG